VHDVGPRYERLDPTEERVREPRLGFAEAPRGQALDPYAGWWLRRLGLGAGEGDHLMPSLDERRDMTFRRSGLPADARVQIIGDEQYPHDVLRWRSYHGCLKFHVGTGAAIGTLGG